MRWFFDIMTPSDVAFQGTGSHSAVDIYTLLANGQEQSRIGNLQISTIIFSFCMGLTALEVLDLVLVSVSVSRFQNQLLPLPRGFSAPRTRTPKGGFIR